MLDTSDAEILSITWLQKSRILRTDLQLALTQRLDSDSLVIRVFLWDIVRSGLRYAWCEMIDDV